MVAEHLLKALWVHAGGKSSSRLLVAVTTCSGRDKGFRRALVERPASQSWWQGFQGFRVSGFQDLQDFKKGFGCMAQVALFSENSSRWLVADQAVMMAGAADAVRGAASPAPEMGYIVRHSDACAIVCQDSATLERLAPVLGHHDSGAASNGSGPALGNGRPAAAANGSSNGAASDEVRGAAEGWGACKPCRGRQAGMRGLTLPSQLAGWWTRACHHGVGVLAVALFPAACRLYTFF